MSTRVLRVGTLNLASGRGPSGRPLAAAELARAVDGLDVDVLAVQEVDACQPRSQGVDQAGVVAEALGLPHWRMAATLAGTPGPARTWSAADPPVLHGADGVPTSPVYGVALLSRLPVRRWSVLGLGAGRGRLPLRATDPSTGRPRIWFFPDEPRAAISAELEDDDGAPGPTVVATHLSFAPVTALLQLRRLREWAPATGPLVLAGDLNLPGGVPARVTGLAPVVRAPTYPAERPRIQFDHLLTRGLSVEQSAVEQLPFGDHRALTATLRPTRT